ncbi:MAG: transposase [Chloroflexota bacterium]
MPEPGRDKVHLTEMCDANAPRLITHVETTVATTTDVSVTEKIQDALIDCDLSPAQYWVDTGYMGAHILRNSQQKGINLIGPMRMDTSWQTKVTDGYDQSKFTIDWERMVATCPEGETSMHWKEGKPASGQPNIHFAFRLPVCKACVARERCTKAGKIGRHVTVSPREIYEALQQARERDISQQSRFRNQICAG